MEDESYIQQKAAHKAGHQLSMTPPSIKPSVRQCMGWTAAGSVE